MLAQVAVGYPRRPDACGSDSCTFVSGDAMPAGADLSPPPTSALFFLPFGRWDSVGVVGRAGSAPSRVVDGAERIVEQILALCAPDHEGRRSLLVSKITKDIVDGVQAVPVEREPSLAVLQIKEEPISTNRPSLYQATRVVMLRQVPQLQTVEKTVEVPPVPFVGRIVDVPAILQINQVIEHGPLVRTPRF